MRLRSIILSALLGGLMAGVSACGGGNSGYLPPVGSPLVPYEAPEIARDDAGDDAEEDFGVEPDTDPKPAPKPAVPAPATPDTKSGTAKK